MNVIRKGLFLVVSIVAMLAGFIGISLLIEKLLVPQDYLFYEFHPITEKLLVWVMAALMILIVLILVRSLSPKIIKELELGSTLVWIWNHIGVWRLAVVIVTVLLLYGCATNVYIVTEDAIICCSPFQPKGVSYGYDEVEQIEAGFGRKRFTLLEYQKKGTFYYKITLGGKNYVFSVPSVNEKIERYEDSYLELEEFDQKLVSLDVPKSGNKDGWEACDLDEVYVDRFVRITENK